MLITETFLKQESDQDKSAHNRFFFLKLCILLNRVFLFHISVNSDLFSQMGRHCSIFCLIMLQKTIFYFFYLEHTHILTF